MRWSKSITKGSTARIRIMGNDLTLTLSSGAGEGTAHKTRWSDILLFCSKLVHPCSFQWFVSTKLNNILQTGLLLRLCRRRIRGWGQRLNRKMASVTFDVWLFTLLHRISNDAECDATEASRIPAAHSKIIFLTSLLLANYHIWKSHFSPFRFWPPYR